MTQNSIQTKAVDSMQSIASRKETWEDQYMWQTLIMPLNALLKDTRTISVF